MSQVDLKSVADLEAALAAAELRLARAEDMLAETEDALNDACDEFGYASVNTGGWSRAHREVARCEAVCDKLRMLLDYAHANGVVVMSPPEVTNAG